MAYDPNKTTLYDGDDKLWAICQKKVYGRILI